jgi:uncharacterized protein with FMN-binding domain
MARKLNKNLVALGSAAIVTVYAVGFVRTSSVSVDGGGGGAPAARSAEVDAATAVARAIATSTPAAASAAAPPAATPSAAGPSPARPPTATPAAASPPAVAASPAPAATARYRDGTFTGSGTSRFGGFDVAVTIEGGTITGVELTRVTTRYPASRIARLPGQVVARQSADVDMVSGATYSARAFRDAVAQALSKAAAGTTTQG